MNGREPDRTKPAGKFAEGATSNVFVVTKGGIGREMEAKYYSNICVPARSADVMYRSRGTGSRHALRKVESVKTGLDRSMHPWRLGILLARVAGLK